MTELDLYNAKHWEEVNRVATLRLQGLQPHEIMKETGLQRKVVMAHLDEWKNTAAVSQAANDRAKDAMNAMDVHFDMLIKRAWEAIEQIEDDMSINGVTTQRIQQKLNAIKTVSELEAKRLDALQKAGLLEGEELGDQMAEVEEKQQKLINILRHDLCPSCQSVVAKKLQAVTGQVEVVVSYE